MPSKVLPSCNLSYLEGRDQEAGGLWAVFYLTGLFIYLFIGGTEV
jgi:hypothetical protein